MINCNSGNKSDLLIQEVRSVRRIQDLTHARSALRLNPARGAPILARTYLPRGNF